MTKMIKLREDGTVGTVAVIINEAGMVHSYNAFIDNPEGNQKAEGLFRQCMNEYGWTGSDNDKPWDVCLEDGYVELGDYTVCLTHS